MTRRSASGSNQMDDSPGANRPLEARMRGSRRTDAMGAVASLPPPAFGVSAEEWWAWITARPNLLLAGDGTVTSQIVGALWPALQEPVWITSAAPLSLPSS